MMFVKGVMREELIIIVIIIITIMWSLLENGLFGCPPISPGVGWVLTQGRNVGLHLSLREGKS